MTQEQSDVIDNYFFIIQTIAERANDEFAIAIKQVCRDAMARFYDFCKKTEITESGFESAKQYIKENHLEYIENEILAAFKQGFCIGVHQERSGKFKENRCVE